MQPSTPPAFNPPTFTCENCPPPYYGRLCDCKYSCIAIVYLTNQQFSIVCSLVDYRNEEKKFEHLDFISNLSFTITVTVFTSISVEILRKIARPLEREKKKLHHHHVISMARVLISNLALEQSSPEKSLTLLLNSS